MQTEVKPNLGGRPRGTGARRSDAVRRTRGLLGLTQEDFAREMGVSVGTVQKLEQQGREPGTQAGRAAFARLRTRATAESQGALR